MAVETTEDRVRFVQGVVADIRAGKPEFGRVMAALTVAKNIPDVRSQLSTDDARCLNDAFDLVAAGSGATPSVFRLDV